jgi:hypothetical protein
MNGLLEAYVPRHEEHGGDWDDVLRRARRGRPRRRLVLVAALVGAALAVGPALGFLLTRDVGPRLPREADRSKVVVITEPHTGRVLVQAAPWKGHDGICYVLLWMRAGCAPRRMALFISPLAGYTFNPHVVSGSAVTLSGKRVPLIVRRFKQLGVTFFLARGRLPRLLREATLYDADGKVVKRLLLKP